MPTPNTTVTKTIKATQVRIALKTGAVFNMAVTTKEDLNRLLYSFAAAGWAYATKPKNRKAVIESFFSPGGGNSYTVANITLMPSNQLATMAKAADSKMRRCWAQKV
jgi:hypothetical protein